MGIHVEEKRLISLPKFLCEERLLTFAKREYELKNHVQDKKESLIILKTKTVLTAKEQRITITLNEKDEKSTEVTIRSEMISNIAARKTTAIQNSVDRLFNGIEIDNPEKKPSDAEKTGESEIQHHKRKFFQMGKDKRRWDLYLTASYLGGHKNLDKSLRGSLAVYPDGVDFCVLGPKFTIFPTEIKKVTICSSSEIASNAEWQASCFTGALERNWMMNDGEKEKEKLQKNKLVIDYANEDGAFHCIFKAEGQFELEKSLQKAENLINQLIK